MKTTEPYVADRQEAEKLYEATGQILGIFKKAGISTADAMNVLLNLMAELAVHTCVPKDDYLTAVARRSEERRVGKEGRSRWSPYH